MCGIAGFLAGRCSVPEEASSIARGMADAVAHRGPDDGWSRTGGVWRSSIRRRPAASRCSPPPAEASSSSMARSTTTSTSDGDWRPSVRMPCRGGDIPIRKRCWPPSSIEGWRRRCGRPPACSPSRSGIGRTGRSVWPATGWAKNHSITAGRTACSCSGPARGASCIRGGHRQRRAHPAPAPRLHLLHPPGRSTRAYESCRRAHTSGWLPALQGSSVPANCRNPGVLLVVAGRGGGRPGAAVRGRPRRRGGRPARPVAPGGAAGRWPRTSRSAPSSPAGSTLRPSSH